MKGGRRTRKRSRINGGALEPQVIPVSLTVAITNGNPGAGTAVIRGLPAGYLLLLGAVADLTFTKVGSGITATFDGDWSIGTTPDANATLATTDVNIIGSTAMGAATAGVSPRQRATNNTAAMIDNRDGTGELNLNVLVDDAAISADDSFTVSGNLTLAVIDMGL